MTMQNPFAGVGSAKVFGSGQYLEPGEYEFEIEKMIFQKVNAGGNALIVEGKLTESNNEKHPVGASRTWYQAQNESFESECKSFCMAAVGYDHGDASQADAIRTKLSPEVIETILLKGVTEARLKGRKVKIKVYAKEKKKKKGEFFNKHVFKPGQPPLF